MAIFDMKNIRNVALLGHSGSGKTSLAEAMLYISGGSDRLGKTMEGTSTFDSDPESVRRKISISAGFAPVEWDNVKINVIDTPGQPDFVGEAAQGLRVADSAVIVVDGKSGVQVGTELGWERAAKAKLPRAIFINKSDDPDAHFENVLDALTEQFGNALCPVTIPGGEDLIIDLANMQAHIADAKGKDSVKDIPDSVKSLASKYRDKLMEEVAGTDEELMMKYFDGEELTTEEIATALHSGIVKGEIVPVYCGCSTKLWGVSLLMSAIADSFPRFDVKGSEKNEEGKDVAIDEKGSPALFVFKTVVDPFVGQMSFFKVMNGSVKSDMTLKNSRSGSSERLAKLYVIKTKQQLEVSELRCGDIGMVSKLSDTATGDTLSADGNVSYRKTEYPTPYYVKGIRALAKGDEDKISSGVNRLLLEDPTIRYEVSKETKQMLLYGMGGTHLELVLAKLKTRYGVGVQLEDKKVAYRESIRKSCQVQGKHKKQSGGHGQYGDVWIEFKPGQEEGLTFTESVVGGTVPKNFFPAVEKGLQECMQKGVLAGYPMVSLWANLYDGSYHPVDSSEMAFKTAASIAYRDGIPKCAPVLLEPIGNLSVVIPSGQVGDVMSDLNKRRGQISTIDPSEEKRGYSVVHAIVPESEMSDYVPSLRSITQGRGEFSFEVTDYAECPANVSEKVIADAKKAQEEANK